MHTKERGLWWRIPLPQACPGCAKVRRLRKRDTCSTLSSHLSRGHRFRDSCMCKQLFEDLADIPWRGSYPCGFALAIAQKNLPAMRWPSSIWYACFSVRSRLLFYLLRSVCGDSQASEQTHRIDSSRCGSSRQSSGTNGSDFRAKGCDARGERGWN